MQKPLRIGELAKEAGVAAQTIRYYERIGLLPRPARVPNGYRVYGEDDADRLALIRHAKGMGLTLKETQATLAVLDEACCGTARPRIAALLEAKIAAIDRRICELQVLRERLDVHRRLVLQRAEGPAAEDSCTVASCACVEEQSGMFVQLEDLRRGGA